MAAAEEMQHIALVHAETPVHDFYLDGVPVRAHHHFVLLPGPPAVARIAW
jgi:hypothetical protein